jgi:LAS superfamily LD-carboxypeptidase LdcB
MFNTNALNLVRDRMNSRPNIGVPPKVSGASHKGVGGMSLTDIGRGLKLDEGAARAFAEMLGAAKSQGIDLLGNINNTYRSVAQQRVLWDNAVKKYGSEAAARKWVAPPGSSNHNRGTAIDFSSRAAADWVGKYGQQYGFENYAPEWWHYNYKG